MFYSLLKKTGFLLFFIAIYSASIGQNSIDFDQYNSIKSEAPIPSVIRTYVSDVHSKKELKGTIEEQFKVNSSFGLDEMLTSGNVLFNDYVTKYVEKVASNVLVKRQDVYKKLTFFTLKSNEVNAFSTDQGMIFVTTGLIAQLASEAELAFILAHEISHYVENHNLNFFKKKKKYIKGNERGNVIKNFEKTIRKLSQYSQNNEFEADDIGFEIFLESAYSPTAIKSAFDILQYSYLPFIEHPFTPDFLNNSDFSFDESYYSIDLKPIDFESDDYEDTLSTHPNILKRKEKLFPLIDSINTTSNQLYIEGKETFDLVQKTCRFEVLRKSLINKNQIESIYYAYSLLSKYPDNYYLRKSLAKGLYFFSKNSMTESYRRGNSSRNIFDETKPWKSSDYGIVEGEIGMAQHFFYRTNKHILNAAIIRHIFDLNKEFPTDSSFHTMYTDLLPHWIDYSEITDSIITNDSIEPIVENSTNKTYYNYLISNSAKLFSLESLLNDSTFLKQYAKAQEVFDERDDWEEYLSEQSSKEIKNIRQKNKEFEMNKLVIVDPSYQRYKKGNLLPFKSEDYTKELSTVVANKIPLTSMLQLKNLDSNDVDAYNDIALFYEWSSEVTESSSEYYYLYPSLNDEVQYLIEKHGTKYFNYTMVISNKTPAAGKLILATLFWPLIPITYPLIISGRNKAFYVSITYNLSTGRIETTEVLHKNGKMKPSTFILKKLTTQVNQYNK